MRCPSFGPRLDKLWTKFELTLGRFGMSLVSVWDQFGIGFWIGLESIWFSFEVVRDWFWALFGIAFSRIDLGLTWH